MDQGVLEAINKLKNKELLNDMFELFISKIANTNQSQKLSLLKPLLEVVLTHKKSSIKDYLNLYKELQKELLENIFSYNYDDVQFIVNYIIENENFVIDIGNEEKNFFDKLYKKIKDPQMYLYLPLLFPNHFSHLKPDEFVEKFKLKLNTGETIKNYLQILLNLNILNF